MTYEPDSFVIVKVPFGYKVLGGWSGGYLDGDSWRMNSGIKSFYIEKECYYFVGYSGSVYRVHPTNERVSMAMAGVIDSIEHVSEIVSLEDFVKEFDASATIDA